MVAWRDETTKSQRSRLDATLRDLGIIQPQGKADRGDPPSRREPSLARTCLFALKLAGSAVVGATITVALWGHFQLWSKRMAPGPQKFQIVAGGKSVVYRSPQSRDERSRGWEAEASSFDPTLVSPAVITTDAAAPVARPNTPVSAAPVKFSHAVPEPSSSRASLAVPMGKLPEIRSWLYQLQDINPVMIASSSSDLVVIDSSGEDGPFSRFDVELMRRKPDGSRRVLLSYLSIGEAENYRWYWPNRSPVWLGQQNPRWRDNYSVRFWHEGWQRIIFEYVDMIVAAGFDGVYLDKVDSYEEMGHREEMVEFVARIAARAKAKHPGFLIFSQNGDQLIASPKFRMAIDAFAREDLLYGETADGVRNSGTSIQESVERLKLLTAEGKPVFVVEYPRTEEQAKDAEREISGQGFVGLMARRSLDVLDR